MAETATETRASRGFRRLSWVVLVATIVVIVSGDIVQATDSGAGCGESWPRCEGAIFPSMEDAATGIEFSHRFLTFVLTGLMVALYVAARRNFTTDHEIRSAVRFAWVWFVIEVAIGAVLVAFGWVEDDASVGRVVADGIHVVNTFLLVGALALVIQRARGGRASFRYDSTAAIGAAVILLIAVTGAINSLADTLFPADTVLDGIREEFGPAAPFLVRIRAVHPVIAILGGTAIFFIARRIGDATAGEATHRPARFVQWVVGGQFALGILNLVLLTPLETQILHLIAADVLWLSFLFMIWSLPQRRAAPSDRDPLPEAVA